MITFLMCLLHIVLKIVFSLDKGDKKDDISETMFKKRPLEWEKDMELKSKFTDKKVCNFLHQ